MTAPLATAVRGHRMPEIAEPVIEVRDLTKRYGRTIIHQHLNFDVRRGEIVSVVGGSGSGKTTLVRQILGLERQSAGTIKLFGEDTSTMSPASRKKRGSKESLSPEPRASNRGERSHSAALASRRRSASSTFPWK